MIAVDTRSIDNPLPLCFFLRSNKNICTQFDYVWSFFTSSTIAKAGWAELTMHGDHHQRRDDDDDAGMWNK